MFDLTQANGAGTDQLQMESMPLLKILNDQAAEVRKSHKDYATKGIEGAEPGDILFLPTQSLFKEIEVIVTGTRVLYTEWIPRSQGGGLAGYHPLSVRQNPNYSQQPDPERPRRNQEKLGDNELMLTYYFSVLFEDQDGVWKDAIIAMSGGQLRHARAWNKKLLGFKYPKEAPFLDKNGKPFQAPIFALKWKLTTFVENNGENSYYSWSIAAGKILHPEEDAAMLNHCLEAFQSNEQKLPSPENAQPQALPSSSESDDKDVPF